MSLAIRLGLGISPAVRAPAGGAAPVFVASHTGTNNSNTGSPTVTLTSDVAIGDLMIIGVWTASSRFVSSVADNVSGTTNSWTSILAASVAPANTQFRVSIVHCKVTTAMPSGTVITLTLSGSTQVVCLGQNFRNLAAVPFDLSGPVASGGADLAPTIGSPGSLAQNSELLIGVTFIETTTPASATLTPATGWGNQLVQNRGTTGKFTMQSRVVSDGTGPARTETISGIASANWTINSATFKGA